MKRFTLVLAAALCCAAANAAPPDIEPELSTWWDNWHDNEGRLAFPMERYASNPGRVIPYSHLKYELVCRRQLHDVMVDPSTSTAAFLQARAISRHWGLLPRGSAPSVVLP
jgi:hypothetical protein